MKFVVILPAMVEDIADRCIESIDKKWHKNLYIVDNSKEGFAHKYKNIASEHHPENIGIGRGWNVGLRKCVDEQLDYAVILSASVVFEDGMSDFVAMLENNHDPHGMETQHAWHMIAIGRKTVEKIGFFDENFYPGYYEDSDYIRRMELAGIHNPMSTTNRLPKVDIKAGYQGWALTIKRGLKVNMEACRDYFVEKWGYEPRYDSQRSRDLLYKYPFNNPSNAIHYFPERSIEELREKYNLVEEEPEEVEPGEDE